MKESKKDLILAYLQRNGTITPDEARIYCRKCERLAARISELRAEGHNIVTDHKDAAGKPVNYAIYRLVRGNAAC
jgi:hypothetical protein